MCMSNPVNDAATEMKRAENKNTYRIPLMHEVEEVSSTNLGDEKVQEEKLVPMLSRIDVGPRLYTRVCHPSWIDKGEPDKAASALLNAIETGPVLPRTDVGHRPHIWVCSSFG
ncbi:hypothetical protein NC652_001890 [Populus alba x Populus x berolinensis]|nr:hypothetical protein NC652_001890 [Populus alba x Populus x berolinensis]